MKYVASSISQMTDYDKYYVYTGHEEGMVTGCWYFWSGTEWLIGGDYQCGIDDIIETSSTMDEEGMPADAKAVGDMIVVSDTEPTSPHTELWIDPDTESVLVPTMDDIEGTYAKKSEVESTYARKAAVGSPLRAATASAMTDVTKIYVYTGSESGYTSGHWYYYDGAAWADGGVYNSTAFVTDKTLTGDGEAADAKVTGDEITDLKSALNTVHDQVFDSETIVAPVANEIITSNYTLYYGVKAKKAFTLSALKTPYVEDTSGAYTVDIFRYSNSVWTKDTTLSKTDITPGDTINYDNIIINVNDVITIANKYPQDPYVKANCKSTNTPSERYLEYFGTLQVYNSTSHVFVDSSGYFAGDITIEHAIIPTVEESVNNIDDTLSDFRSIEGEYQTQSITVIQDKYIYTGNTSESYDGTVQNSTDCGYAKVEVVEGEHYKISGSSNNYRPLVVLFTDTTINHSNFYSALYKTTSQQIYSDIDITIPQGIKMICVNTNNYTNYPIVVKKFIPANRIKYLYDLSINSFAKNPLQYYGNEISMFDKILCIGDSLTAGGFNTPDITPDQSHATRDTSGDLYSYPHNLNKNYGCQYTKKATGGITSSGWISTYGEDDLTGHDCAIIFLGSNDYMLVRDSGMTRDQAVETNYANLLSIISLVQEQNYGIPIFLCTLFPGWGDAYNVGSGCSENVRTICENTNGVFLIDFSQHSLLTSDSPYRYTHPTSLGYEQMAREIAGAVSYHVNTRLNKFRWIQYVGTQWGIEIQ